MESLERAETEISRGRFQTALQHLAGTKLPRNPQHRLAHNIATADALQLTGDNEKATQLARAGLRSAGRTPASDARCLNVIALAAFEKGQLKQSLSFFQRARSAAETGHDLQQTCRILLDLLANLADSLSPDAVAAILSDCKRAVANVGHPHLEARLSLVAAEIEGKRGFLDLATSHLRAAELLLSSSPNSWLEGLLYLNGSTVHALNADSATGLQLARQALECAETSGHTRTKLGAIANLAYLNLWEGRVDEADAHCRRGLGLAVDISEVRIALLETQAEIMLARSRWADCESRLSQIQTELSCDQGFRTSWYGLVTVITKARLQLQQRDWRIGLATCQAGVELAASRGDRLHNTSLRVLGADALIELGRSDEAAEWIEQAAQKAEDAPTAVYAEVERARAALLAHTSGPAAARGQFERALRVLAAEGSAAARMDAVSSYLRTMKPANEGLRRQLAEKPLDLTPLVSASLPGTNATRIQDTPAVPHRVSVGLSQAAPLMRLAQKADLLAQEVFVLLRESGCAESLAIVEQQGDQIVNIPAHEGCTADQAARLAKNTAGAVVMSTGRAGDRVFSVVVTPRDDVAARSLIHDVKTVVGSAWLLESFREKERVKSSAWPPDLSPVRDGGVFASESMLQLLATATQVARGIVPVLITGVIDR